MPFSIESWMADYCLMVNKTFGARVRFIGLQGSFARGEATAHSDIDAVLILDRADAADLTAYSALLDRLPERERSCGFISGWEELTHWEPSELLQFYYDTIPYEGSLDPLLRQITPESARQAVHAGACGIYHGCAHNLVHDHSPDILRGLFKSALFVLQAEGYRLTGRYIREPDALAEALPEADRALLQTARRVKGEGIRPEEMNTLSAMLLRWASDKIINL